MRGMALYWRKHGKSLLDRLNELFMQYGYFCEKTINKVFPGAEGVGIMQNMMKKLRTSALKDIAGVKVVTIRDIENSCAYNPAAPEKKETVALPVSNVLQYYLEDGTIISVRPSGTEPKIKFYIIHPQPVNGGDMTATRTQAEKQVQLFEQALDTLA